MIRQVRVDMSKLSFSEVRRFAGKMTVLWPLLRLLGVIPRYGAPFPAADDFRSSEVGWDALPDDVREAFTAFTWQATREGFCDPVYQRLKGPSQETSAIALRHASGRHVARHVIAVDRATSVPTQSKATGVIALAEDGRWLVATDQAQKFDDTPEVVTLRAHGAALAGLMELVREPAARARRLQLRAVAETPEHLRDTLDSYERAADEHFRARGLWTDSEPLANTEPQASHEAGDMPDVADPFEHAVLAELERRETQKTSWLNTLAVAVFSLMLFVAIGGLAWSWHFAAILAAVVVVHEMGHYVLMRAFGYRNLKMFFVPLVGAAVTGQAHGVPGWKKALVSLAGPVPGILIALALIPVGAFVDSEAAGELIVTVAFVSFALNGLNLLPFLPLDGGWVVESLYTSRHPFVSVAFRALASAALVVLGIAMDSTVMMVLGFFMLTGIPAAWRMARITRAIQGEDLPLTVSGTTIPRESAALLLRRLRDAMPGNQHAGIMASHVANLYERLSSRPPGWLATLVITLVHVGAAIAAVLGLFVALALREDFGSGY